MNKEQENPLHACQLEEEQLRPREGGPLNCWDDVLSLKKDSVCIWREEANRHLTVLYAGSVSAQPGPSQSPGCLWR